MKLPHVNLFLGLIILVSSSSSTTAFTPSQRSGGTTTTTTTTTTLMANKEEDPNQTPSAKIANSISKLFTSFNPLNNGKKALVQALAGEYDKEKYASELKGLITNEPLLMLSFTKWPFCVKAKQILKSKGVNDYKVLELDVLEDGNAYRAEMAELIDRTSVPAIWINGEFIGGCNDGGPTGTGIVQLEQSGKLDTMLKEAGAL
jgi:glutaredoxin 3